MITVRTTTKPGFHDTEEIAREKWNQQKGQANTSTIDGTVVYPSVDVRWHDTTCITLEKILQKLQG